MATKSKIAEKPVMDEETAQQVISLLSDDSFNAESLNPALESLYAEMGMSDEGSATVHITKINSDGRGGEAQIWRGDPENYDLERIAKSFGSGDYRVKVYVRIPTGQKVLKGNKVFTWLLSPEDEARRNMPQTLQSAQPAINPSELSRMITEGIRAALPPAPVVQPVDPMNMMKQFAEIMAIMRPMTNEAPQVVPQQNPLAMMRDMAELMEMLRGDSPPVGSATGNDLMLKAIEKFAPLLSGVLAQGATIPPGMPPMQQMQAIPQHVPQQAHIAPPVQPAQPMQAAPQSTEEDMNFKLKMGLAFLRGQCDAGGAPETYAEVVLDSVPVESVQMLISSPDPVGYLAQFDPLIKNEPYAAWFNELIDACKDMLQNGETEQSTEGGKNDLATN